MWILDGMKQNKNVTLPAIVSRTGSLSFQEVWKRSEQLAMAIEATNKHTPVVIYGDKNPNMVPTMLAALKTGRAYVPVDVSFPIERLHTIANIVDTCAIFNYSEKKVELPYLVYDSEYITNMIFQYTVTEDISEEHWVGSEDNCYILFTSGSTGMPKGVPITKANLQNFVDWFSSVVKPESTGQNVLNQVSYSFDASVEILYIYLAYGKSLICVDKGLIEDISGLVQWVRQNEISIWSSTPSFFDICGKSAVFCGENLPNLKTIIVGGEVLTKHTAEMILTRFPNAHLLNVYGPTEATVEVTACEVMPEMLTDSRSIPIGRVMSEAAYFIKDENDHICEDGKIGELIIVSKSVANGYYHDEVHTQKSFFRAEDGRMGYRTGDLVFSDAGMIYFIGRKDFQVKLNGYRIELDDISRNLEKIDIVSGNIVLPIYDEQGKVQYLAAFVTINQEIASSSTLKNIITIKTSLKQLIPVYMIPQKIFILDSFPLNVSGKIDRKALLKLL